jgi:hypothetical protein
MALELRSLNHKAGCNPRLCPLLYCPEVPGDVTSLMAKRVTYRDRWDPESRQEAHFKGPNWEQSKKTFGTSGTGRAGNVYIESEHDESQED